METLASQGQCIGGVAGTGASTAGGSSTSASQYFSPLQDASHRTAHSMMPILFSPEDL